MLTTIGFRGDFWSNLAMKPGGDDSKAFGFTGGLSMVLLPLTYPRFEALFLTICWQLCRGEMSTFSQYGNELMCIEGLNKEGLSLFNLTEPQRS